MRKVVILLCLVLTLRLNAQDKPVLIKLAPLCLVDEVSVPTIQSGIEFSITPKISWYNEIGFRYRTGMFEETDTSFVAVKGFKVKTELRYYFRKGMLSHYSSTLEGAYMAANLFYTRDVHNASAFYYYQGDSSIEKTDVFGITKNIWGFNMLMGKQTSINKRFMFDLYIGLGVRYRNMSSVNKEFDYERDELKPFRHITVDGFKERAEAKDGNSIMPHLTMGVRIGLKL